MLEALSGAPGWMAGVALLVTSTAWSINKAGPELRMWRKGRK